MIDKIFSSAAAALADVADGATVMIGGFGTAGLPDELIDALIEQGARDLTVVNNNAGNGDTGLAALLAAGRVRKIICSFPRQADSQHFDGFTAPGRSSSNWCRRATWPSASAPPAPASAASSRPPATAPSWPKARRRARSTAHGACSKRPIHADVALIKAERGDRWGNLTYRKTARNFGPVMAMAARTTVATVHEVVELGALDPERGHAGAVRAASGAVSAGHQRRRFQGSRLTEHRDD